MYPLVNHNSSRIAVPSIQRARARRLVVAPLVAADEAEVMEFLGERPTRTFGMMGFIRDNGLVSPYNRGTFYGCRNAEGRLIGVALIGRFILFEARSDGVVEAFARTAQKYPNAHLLLGEQEEAQEFWSYYAEGGQAPRLFCCELLFELRWPVDVQQAVPGLRLATLDDLELIVPSHARTVVEESGIDPLEVDPTGFRQRCQRRIEQGRSWVSVERGKLIFKAEVVSDTRDVIYLEGVEVNPEERGKGHGLRCISQLSRTLLQRTTSVCLFVNQRNKVAEAFYRRAGYQLIGYYDSIFLKQNSGA